MPSPAPSLVTVPGPRTPRPPRPVFAAVACLGAIFGVGCAGPATDLREELAAARAEIASLRQQLAAERGDVSPTPASPELAEDLQLENRRLEKLAGVTAKGELVENEDARFRDVYDPAAGRSLVLSRRIPAESDARIDLAGYALAAGFSHPGPSLEAADRPIAALILLLETTRNSSVRLANASAASLRIAGEGDAARPVAVASYEVLVERSTPRRIGRGQGSSGADTRDERLVFSLDRDAARALARSNGGELELPGLTLRLGREHAALVRAALLRSE